MIRSLHIENLAVIRRLDVDFDNGFSALTGETGAGKSIIIDSINLLLGNRVNREIIRTGEESAAVSAVFEELSPKICAILSEMGFEIEDASLMLRRSITRDGKSRTLLNGQVITQTLQREVARLLVSIHGQSDSQKLLQKAAHGDLLDAYAGTDPQKEAYQALYREWKVAQKKLAATTRDEGEKLRLIEMLKFQIADIDAMKLKNGEEEQLTRERDRLLNLERINRQVDQTYRCLRGGDKGGALDLIARAENALRSLSGVVEGVEELIERLESSYSEILDVAETALAFADDDREDPTARIDRIEARLEGISKLKRKYGATVGEILAFRARAAEQLEETELSDEACHRLTREVEALQARAAEAAARLSEARKLAAGEVTSLVTESLVFLDMPKVHFEIRIDPAPLGESGADEIEFMIATNPGEPLLPMIRIASGGELSRIMLALRSVINDRDGADTVIFDEIDTGVSGKTARKIGIKLAEASKRAQMLCVTHSAQIASLADRQYLISKSEHEGRAETAVSLLSEEERIEEIARILGGIEVTDLQRNAARQMLEEYRV